MIMVFPLWGSLDICHAYISECTPQQVDPMRWGVQYGQGVESDRSRGNEFVPDYPRCPTVVSREVCLLYRPHAFREEIFLYVWEVVVGHYTTVILPFPGDVLGWPGVEGVLFLVDHQKRKDVSRILFFYRTDLVMASRLRR